MFWLTFGAVLLDFAYTTHDSAVCSVPEKNKASVTALLLNMARSVELCVDPNPSVLLALNLGDNNLDPESRNRLIKQLKKDAVTKVSKNLPFSSGKVALYTLALRSSCCNPTKIPKPGGSLNLVTVLEKKTKAEIAKIVKDKIPVTTFYQVALDVLALCVMNSRLAFEAGATLAQAVPSHPSELDFSIDTAAVAVMAFTCVLSMDDVPPEKKDLVESAQFVLLDLMVLEQKSDGTIGNIYSTGLAGQAFTAAHSYYPPESWNCSLTLQKVLNEIPHGTFSLPIAAAQVLPFLQGRSYFSVKDIQCPINIASVITVEYSIVNDLVENYFQHTVSVPVPEGSTLLQVMEKAEEINPNEFSFVTQETEWGTYVTSINGLSEDANERTYWQFFNGTVPLELGVGSYVPKNYEHTIAIFSTY